MEKRQHIQASVTLNQPQSDTHVMCCSADIGMSQRHDFRS